MVLQPAILAKTVLDTIGSGDTFTAAFVVALVEGRPKKEFLRFATAYVFALIISCFEQIKLLDSSADCSGSGNNTVMDASLEGESMACNKTSVLNSSGELNEVLSED
ncbi:hypothetical protein JHK86_004718 [Glycine max]|nr:hypothetical protein JHK86_004718 [Glycine max]